MASRHHLEQERMERLCCLSVLGEISAEEKLALERHLQQCEECRELRRDLEQIALFDLSAAAAGRMESQVAEGLNPEDESRLFAQLVRRMQAGPREVYAAAEPAPVSACSPPLWKRLAQSLRILYPLGGWALAGLLLALWVQSRRPARPAPNPVTPQLAAANQHLQTQVEYWQSQTAAAQRSMDQVLTNAEAARAALIRSTEESRRLLAEKDALASQVTSMKAALQQEASAQQVAQTSLDSARSAEQAAENQLHLVSLRLERQQAESAHLREVAATTMESAPMRDSDFQEADARELFGARDLHIVDVYDVDHSGKASQIYGRVYYVNHHLLLFYAFDLGLSEKSRKPVAFQAWGYRQPNSTTAESLGLFYMDDAKLDRWVLRVTDPHILARIDTLFVTVEPPGGSQSPRGRRLLMASLAGPPNHP